jgi:hypothetical protein
VAFARRRAPTLAARPTAPVTGSARRLDWRFLLPVADDDAFDSLRLLSDDPALADQITGAGLARTVLIGTQGAARVDAVVSLSGSPAELARALATLRPGGVVYAEIDRARRDWRGWSPARLRRRLARSGLVTAGYWRRRRGAYDSLFLPLDVPGAVPWYLRELVDDRAASRRIVQLALAVLVGRDGRRLAPLARRYSVTGVAGRRGDAPAPTPGLLATDDDGVLPVVLARGEGPWSRVVLLPFGPTDTRPRTVIKLPRTAQHNWATEREQRALTAIRSLLPPELAGTVPAPLGIRTWSGLSVGTESFLPGRPLAFAGEDDQMSSAAQLDGAVGWLIDLHRATRCGDLPADELDSRPGPPEPWRADGVVVPLVWQHCDLTPANVRWDGRRHTVVDWEAARPGPALCDLFYLLLHWKWDDLPAVGTDPGEVFRRVFLLDEGEPALLASTQVRRYCAALGVDARLTEPLLLHMLGQQAGDRAERLRDSGDGLAQDDNLYADLVRLVLGSTGLVPAWSHP